MKFANKYDIFGRYNYNLEKKNIFVKKIKKRVFSIILSIILLFTTVSGCITNNKNIPTEKGENITTQQFKILHIMSYHSPWKWTDDQFDGFKAGLNYSNIDYYVFHLRIFILMNLSIDLRHFWHLVVSYHQDYYSY